MFSLILLAGVYFRASKANNECTDDSFCFPGEKCIENACKRGCFDNDAGLKATHTYWSESQFGLPFHFFTSWNCATAKMDGYCVNGTLAKKTMNTFCPLSCGTCAESNLSKCPNGICVTCNDDKECAKNESSKSKCSNGICVACTDDDKGLQNAPASTGSWNGWTCAQGAANGHCFERAARDGLSMRTHCKISCGFCSCKDTDGNLRFAPSDYQFTWDRPWNCASAATAGHCINGKLDKMSMEKYCPASCNLCGETGQTQRSATTRSATTEAVGEQGGSSIYIVAVCGVILVVAIGAAVAVMYTKTKRGPANQQPHE